MLRTMITETPLEQTWVLRGKLKGQWAIDLKCQWMGTKNAGQGRKCIVDLEDVTSVDVEGENVLKQILSEDVWSA
jgi:hypothetical protein